MALLVGCSVVLCCIAQRCSSGGRIVAVSIVRRSLGASGVGPSLVTLGVLRSSPFVSSGLRRMRRPWVVASRVAHSLLLQSPHTSESGLRLG